MYEGHALFESAATYPRCVAGARKCPPDDCGGTSGYVNFLEAISDPAHPEHEELVAWVGGRFDPDEFDPAHVVFDDPQERLQFAMEG